MPMRSDVNLGVRIRDPAGNCLFSLVRPVVPRQTGFDLFENHVRTVQLYASGYLFMAVKLRLFHDHGYFGDRIGSCSFGFVQ